MKAVVSGEYEQEPGVVMKPPLAYSMVHAGKRATRLSLRSGRNSRDRCSLSCPLGSLAEGGGRCHPGTGQEGNRLHQERLDPERRETGKGSERIR